MSKTTRTTRSVKIYTILMLVLPSLFILPTTSYGQNTINSPYSMFGPGEVKGNEYFRNMSLGGISQGFRSNVSVNYLNPASYTAIDSLSFVVDATVFSHIYQQNIHDMEQQSTFSALGNINFAFPLNRWWRVAAGLLPYSQVGYHISDFSEDPITGRVNYTYDGSGGINQVYMGHGFRLSRNLSAGLNVSYLFGKTEDNRIASSDSTGFYRTAWNYTDDIDGVMFHFGLQWMHQFSEQRNITLGASYTPSTDLQLKQTRYVVRDLPGVTGIDTLDTRAGESGDMHIPAALGAGAFMQFNDQWGAGLDMQYQEWSAYATHDQSHNLNDGYQVRAGAIYNPPVETYSGFLSRWEYRMGARFGQSFLKLDDPTGNEQSFDEFGISFGFAVPVRRSRSGLNFGFEYSVRQANHSDMIDETFFRFNIGLNIYERWFVRRRFF